MKTAVVLLNLGGPLRKEDIRPFLFRFLMDKRVVTVPLPLRFIIATLVSLTRGEAYAPLGYKSPLLENTKAQAAALQALLPEDKVFVCMRHWHPLTEDVAKEVRAYKPEKIVLIPLYPQYSTTTTLSALDEWRRHGDPATEVCCYHTQENFIAASADLIEKAGKAQRILFSAHGLPESIIRAGDPYQKQCEESAAAIAARLNLSDWALCYQSRVGRQKWIGPSLNEEIERAGRDGVSISIFPLSFVSEHVETLVELDIEAREYAGECGVPSYVRVPAVGTHPDFIRGLRDLVLGVYV